MNKALDKKDRILQAGLTVMSHNGYNGTGVKDIVDAAGIPKGSFYNYFESKEAFVIEALQSVSDCSISTMRSTLNDSSQQPIARILDYFECAITDLKAGGCAGCGCFIGTICQEMSTVNQQIRCTTEKLLNKNKELLSECLQEAKQVGTLPSQYAVESLAGFILCAWQGALLRMKADRNAESLDDFIFWLKVILQA